MKSAVLYKQVNKLTWR